MAVGIGSTCARDTCIGSTCTAGAWIRCVGVGGAFTRGICARNAFVEGLDPRALAGLRVTLTGLGVNDCCLQSLMGLNFALTEEMSC